MSEEKPVKARIVVGNDEAVIEFRHINDVGEWINSEIEFWNWARELNNDPRRERVEKISQWRNNNSSQSSVTDNDWKLLTTLINELYNTNPKLPYTQTHSGESLLGIKKHVTKSQFAKIVDKFNDQHNAPKNPQAEAYYAMHILGLPFDTPAMGNLIQEHHKAASEARNSAEEELAKIRSAVAELEDLYGTKLGLEAPAKYWKDRAKSASNERWVWAGIAAGAAIIWTLLIGCILVSFISGNDMTVPNYGMIASLVATLTVGGAILNILVKNYLSSAHSQRKSEEKSVLINTYLAIAEESHKRGIPPNEDLVKSILAAIFESEQTGLIGKIESSPLSVENLVNKLKL